MLEVELSLSAVAWAAVLLFQAVVHFSLRSARLNNNAENQKWNRSGSANTLEDSDDSVISLDGDEPEDLIRLLSQTGSEMMKGVSSSRVPAFEFEGED